MPSIPSNSNKPLDYVLTRPAQRSPKSHRVPSAGRRPAAAGPADDSVIFCLSTVAAYGVILDFEASAVVIGGVRRFMAPRELEVLAALLFAEGGIVTVAEIYRLCGFAAPNAARDVVNRFVRRLRLLAAPLGSIASAADGYRFSHREPGDG